MAVCYVCGKSLNQNVSARAVSAHIRECEKKHGKKKRFNYMPVGQRIAPSSTSQQPDKTDIPDLSADGPNLPGTLPPGDGPKFAMSCNYRQMMWTWNEHSALTPLLL
jgi:hypothetical protein